MTAQMPARWAAAGLRRRWLQSPSCPCPSHLMLQHWPTMNAFEPLLWTAVLWAAVRIVQRQEPGYWLLAGG